MLISNLLKNKPDRPNPVFCPVQFTIALDEKVGPRHRRKQRRMKIQTFYNRSVFLRPLTIYGIYARLRTNSRIAPGGCKNEDPLTLYSRIASSSLPDLAMMISPLSASDFAARMMRC